MGFNICSKCSGPAYYPGGYTDYLVCGGCDAAVNMCMCHITYGMRERYFAEGTGKPIIVVKKMPSVVKKTTKVKMPKRRKKYGY